MQFVVVLDACVLYPAALRDLLLRLAMTGLFAAKWTQEIQEEWIRNVLKKRPALKDALARTHTLMGDAIPDAVVTGYEELVEGLALPDADDRHVLAAAIRANAQIIVTFNTKDFPQAVLDSYGIEAVHPDEFIEHQFGLNQGLVLGAVKRQRAALRNPPRSVEEFLETLAANGLAVTADRLREFADLI